MGVSNLLSFSLQAFLIFDWYLVQLWVRNLPNDIANRLIAFPGLVWYQLVGPAGKLLAVGDLNGRTILKKQVHHTHTTTEKHPLDLSKGNRLGMS